MVPGGRPNRRTGSGFTGRRQNMPNAYFSQHINEPLKQGPMPSATDRLDSQLAQNIALVMIEKQYDRAENHALWALTSLMKEYIQDVGMDMKDVAEAQGRQEPSMIDALNVCFEREMT